MTHRAREGDLYAVPLADGQTVLCRVLYKSTYFKHVALVGCYGRLNETIPYNEQIKSGLLGMPLYTTVQPRQIPSWIFLENHSVLEQEHLMSRRLVGGEVWLGDDYLGPPKKCDENLEHMDVYGERLFLKKLANIVTLTHHSSGTG
jgi:hypothetical protein